MKLKASTALLLLSLAAPAMGQSLEQIKEAESFNHIEDLLDQADQILETSSRTRKTDCIKAVGDQAFCSCINDKLAIAWSFSDYVAIVTREKAANGYDRLDAGMKVAYDNVAPARDQCVAATVAPK